MSKINLFVFVAIILVLIKAESLFSLDSQGQLKINDSQQIQQMKQAQQHLQIKHLNSQQRALNSHGLNNFFHVQNNFRGDYQVDQKLIDDGRTLFNYLDFRVGIVQAEFCISRQDRNLYEIYIKFFNPKYNFKKTVSLRIKELNFSETNYKIEQTVQFFMHNQSKTIGIENQSLVQFSLSGNINSESISFTLKGSETLSNISVSAQLSRNYQELPNTLYLIYVCLANLIQVLSIWIFLRQSQNRKFLANKPAQSTVILCMISDLYLIIKPFTDYFENNTDGGHFGNYLFSIPYTITFVFELRFLVKIDSVWEFISGMRSHLPRKKNSTRKNQLWYKILKKVLYYLGLVVLFILVFLLLFFGMLILILINWGFQQDSQFLILSGLIFVPQILKNSSKSAAQFYPFYIFGYLGSRILFPLYITFCPQNIRRLQPRISLGLLILSIELVQILILYLQFRLGPRFFLPKCLQPNYFAYSKHRAILFRDDQNQNMQCLVCCQKIFKVKNKSKGQRKILNESNYEQELLDKIRVLKTPCQHYFHQQCLIDWMQAKLQCPDCQSDIAILTQK